MQLTDLGRTGPPTLVALMSAATALTVNVHAQTTSGENDSQVSYRFNFYDEDGFDGPSVGNSARYSVRSQQFLLNAQIDSTAALSVTATHEVMSGSSPWYVVPDATNRPIQVLSGATIREHRNELRASYTFDPGTSSKGTISASYSQERDYRAMALGFERSIPLSSALALGVGGNVSVDVLDPTDANLYGRVRHERKNSSSVFGSVGWVIDRDSVLQTGVQLSFEDGYLSDPYKLVSVGGDILADKRPDRRAEAAWLFRYRRALSGPGSALHLDYRFVRDSWRVASHTLDLGWYETFARSWQLIPAIRYYSQAHARFYAPFFLDTGTQFHSSDYRLGTFGSLSASVNLRKRLAHWELSAGAERYHAATKLALGGADGAVPAALAYTLVFAGVEYHFD